MKEVSTTKDSAKGDSLVAFGWEDVGVELVCLWDNDLINLEAIKSS